MRAGSSSGSTSTPRARSPRSWAAAPRCVTITSAQQPSADRQLPLAGLGFALVALLALAAAAASAHGSSLSQSRPELTDLPGAVFLAAAGGAFALYVLALVVVRRRRPSLAVV